MLWSKARFEKWERSDLQSIKDLHAIDTSLPLLEPCLLEALVLSGGENTTRMIQVWVLLASGVLEREANNRPLLDSSAVSVLARHRGAVVCWCSLLIDSCSQGDTYGTVVMPRALEAAASSEAKLTSTASQRP